MLEMLIEISIDSLSSILRIISMLFASDLLILPDSLLYEDGHENSNSKRTINRSKFFCALGQPIQKDMNQIIM